MSQIFIPIFEGINMFNTCFGLSAEYIIDTAFKINPAS